ncbi:MAG: methyltransferase domain-containing protein [Clostridia bacterium]|nr:methyltransferase domain-containing protein [Clostridia bacterium]
MQVFDSIICPVCGETLYREGKTVLCVKGHTFDIAKAGYVNLLPPGKEKNARTGDEKIMVKARVDFLSKDYYALISDRTAEILRACLSENALFADLGCGEGYHTCRIAEKIGFPVTAFGFDASKFAAEYASKRAKAKNLMPKDGVGAEHDHPAQAYFFPANLFHLPLKDHVLDAAVSMFAPVAGEETHRILKPGGKLVVVSSGRDHLLELRQLIYEEVRFSDAPVPVPDGFVQTERQNLRVETTVTSREDLQSLFVMTPFYYKTTEEGRARLLSNDSLRLTVDVNFSVFEAI